MPLVKLFVNSNRFSNTLTSRRDKLYRMAFAWCHDAMLSDDLVQETLAKALHKQHQLKDEKCLNAWLFTILNNCWKEHLRHAKPDVELDEATIQSESCPVQEFEELQIVNQVRVAIRTLTHDQRQVVTLVDLEGYSYSEVSTILNVPIGTVMSRLSRARKTLQRVLRNTYRDNTLPISKLHRIK